MRRSDPVNCAEKEDAVRHIRRTPAITVILTMIAVTVFPAVAWCSSVQALVDDFDAFAVTLIAAVCTGLRVWGAGCVVPCCCTTSAKGGRPVVQGAHPPTSEEVCVKWGADPLTCPR